MNAPILAIVLIGNVIATSYRSVPSQTKPKDCEWTASGERCNVHGIAVSEDLLQRNGGPLKFGDVVYIEGIGLKFVNDVMNKRHHQRVDVWVQTYADEKAFDKKYHGRILKLWKVGGTNEREIRTIKAKAH